MNDQEFREILAFGREKPGIEFKGPGSRTANKQLQAKVIRAMLSMANRRDGGLVIVGVDEDNTEALVPTGLTEVDLKTWKYDDLADAAAEYADPNVGFDIETLEFDSKKFLTITVREFDDVPVICKRNYEGVLRAGACYVRTRRKPETVEIPSQTEIRDLLDVAITKALRKFLSIGRTAGIDFEQIALKGSEAKFNEQLGDLLEE